MCDEKSGSPVGNAADTSTCRGRGSAARREELAVRGVVRLRLGQHPVHPREELLGAVVCVQDHRHAVFGGERAHVVSARHRPSDGRVKVGVVEALARIKLSAARRELNHHRSLGRRCRLEAGVDGGGRDAVNGRNGVAPPFCVLKQVYHRLTGEHARLHRRRQAGVRSCAAARRRRAAARRALGEVLGEGLCLVDCLLLTLWIVWVDHGRRRISRCLATAEALAAIHGDLGRGEGARRGVRSQEGGGQCESGQQHVEESWEKITKRYDPAAATTLRNTRAGGAQQVCE